MASEKITVSSLQFITVGWSDTLIRFKLEAGDDRIVPGKKR